EVSRATARDPRLQRVDPQPPPREVDLVHAVISGVAGAEVEPPVPGVMESVLLERNKLGRSDPRVVVEPDRRLPRLLLPDPGPELDVPRPRHQHVADHLLTP